MNLDNYPNSKKDLSLLFVVADSSTLSQAVRLKGAHPCGLVCPGAVDGTEITFMVSSDNVNFKEVINPDDGLVYTVKIKADSYVPLNFQYLFGVGYLKLKASSAQSVNREFLLTTTI